MSFVSGDGLSNDIMCGHKQPYINCPRLCCACICDSHNSDNAYHSCIAINKHSVECLSLVANSSINGEVVNKFSVRQSSEALVNMVQKNMKYRYQVTTSILDRIFSSHQLDNVWDQIDFGNNGNLGIYGSTPTDMMYAFEEVIVPYILHILFDPIPISMQAETDLYVESILLTTNLWSSECEFFPRVNFTRGFTRLTVLIASEKIGASMGIVIFLRTERGKQIMGPRFQQSFTTRVNKKISNSNALHSTTGTTLLSDNVSDAVFLQKYNPKNYTHRKWLQHICQSLYIEDTITIVKSSLNEDQQLKFDSIIFETVTKDIDNLSIEQIPELHYNMKLDPKQTKNKKSYSTYIPSLGIQNHNRMKKSEKLE